MNILKRIWHISKRELSIFLERPLFLFCMLLSPIAMVFFFTTLMWDGLPKDLPAAIVDMDDTSVSRIICRTIDSMEETNIVAKYCRFDEARKAMDRGQIYAFFYIPKGTTESALSNRQPLISFYTNEAYLLPGTLLMKELRYGSELSGLALTREKLYAKGKTEREAMGIIQPIRIEGHPLGNPYLNYSVYLSNILIPGVFILITMLSTTYVLGMEWKNETQRDWYKLSGNNTVIAFAGKLLPQTLLFSLMIVFMDVWLYKYLGYPCKSGMVSMTVIGLLSIIAAQGLALFLFGLFSGQMRLTMCLCSLWGVLSFSMCGFTFPVTAMGSVLEGMSCLFPLRHYYLLYVNQALNGISIWYAWKSIIGLLAFVGLPLLVMKRYKMAFTKFKYKP